MSNPDMRLPEIVGSFEWFDTPTGRDCQCARCGSSVEQRDCWACGGDGYVPEDTPEGWDEGDERPCDICHGHGGSLRCVSSPAYCNDHPLPGREHIESTALEPEAWRDA